MMTVLQALTLTRLNIKGGHTAASMTSIIGLRSTIMKPLLVFMHFGNLHDDFLDL